MTTRRGLPLILTAVCAFLSCRQQGRVREDVGGTLSGMEAVVAAPVYSSNRMVLCASPGVPDLRVHEKNPRFMPLWLRAPEQASGIKAGDVVGFDLRVDWNDQRPVLVTAIKKLRDGKPGAELMGCEDVEPAVKK